MKTLVCMRLAAYTLLAIFLGSCSFGGRFAYDAIDFNKTVEKAANAQILLNALRASDRKPMHFSTISQLRGGHNISSTGGLSFSIPFGADAASAYTVSPSLSLTRSTSPSFDVGVLDTQEFHQGILQPTKMDTLEFYWQQRWPPELLLHLFIHKVEKIEECKIQEDEKLNKAKKMADAAKTKVEEQKTKEEKEAEQYVKKEDEKLDKVKKTADAAKTKAEAQKTKEEKEAEQYVKKEEDKKTEGCNAAKKTQEDEKLDKAKKMADAAKTKDEAQKTDKEKEAEEYMKREEDKKNAYCGEAKQDEYKKEYGYKKEYEVYENAPEYRSFICFRAWVEERMWEGLVVGRKQNGTGIGPKLLLDGTADLKRLVGVQAAKLGLIKVGDSQYRLCEVETKAAFCFGKCKSETAVKQCAEEEPTSAAILGIENLAEPEKGEPKKDYIIETTYKIHLRSVQGMLYHLGELVRAWETGIRKVEVKSGHGPRRGWKETPLFRLKPVSSFSAGDSPLAVEYEGTVYMVPVDDQESGLSNSAMSLVVQLLGLNKTGKELPKTTAVEVVGR